MNKAMKIRKFDFKSECVGQTEGVINLFLLQMVNEISINFFL